MCNRPRRHLAVLACAAALVAATVACSDDDGGGTGDGTNGDVATTATDATTTTAAPPTAATPTTAHTTTAAPTTAAPETQALHEPGPYDVGVITLDLGDRRSEVWYPAEGVSGDTEVFDTLSVFPDEVQPLIPEELSGLVDTGAYRDATPSSELTAGSAPLVIYSHGFGAFRQVATAHTVALASWGNVVASTDHLERGIVSQALGTVGGAEDQDLADVTDTIDAVLADARVGPLVDAESVAITGHSAGAGTAARYASEDVIDGYVSISGGAPDRVAQKPALVVIGELDTVVEPSRSRELYDALESDATLVDIADAGHNSFTDACRRIRDIGGLAALAPLIGEDQVARAEDGCVPPSVQPEVAIAALNHYTVAFLDVVFDNPLVDDGATALGTDVSGTIEVEDLDAGADGDVPVELAEFASR